MSCSWYLCAYIHNSCKSFHSATSSTGYWAKILPQVYFSLNYWANSNSHLSVTPLLKMKKRSSLFCSAFWVRKSTTKSLAIVWLLPSGPRSDLIQIFYDFFFFSCMKATSAWRDRACRWDGGALCGWKGDVVGGHGEEETEVMATTSQSPWWNHSRTFLPHSSWDKPLVIPGSDQANTWSTKSWTWGRSCILYSWPAPEMVFYAGLYLQLFVTALQMPTSEVMA